MDATAMLMPDEPELEAEVPVAQALPSADGHVHLRLVTDPPSPVLTREQRRSRRKRLIRPRTENLKRMPRWQQREVRREADLIEEELGGIERPVTRADCGALERPCPFVGCQWHLYLSVSEQTGSIKLNFPELEPDELEHSCALDLANRGPSTLEEVALYMNLTRERVRQLQFAAFQKLRNTSGDAELRELLQALAEQGAESTDRTVFDGESDTDRPGLSARDVSDTSGVHPARGDIMATTKTILDDTCTKDGCPRFGVKEYGGLCTRHHAGVLNSRKQRGVPKKRNGKPSKRSLAAAAVTASKKTPSKYRRPKPMLGHGDLGDLTEKLLEQLQPASEALALVEKIGWERARTLAGWLN